MDIKSYLEDLGYELIDDGSWWRTNAIYRGGDNRSSMAIEKKTGRFFDFAENKRGSLQTLIELTTGKEIEDFDEFVEEKDLQISSDSPVRPTQNQEKTWPDSTLDKLVPHYKFYEARGISKSTLRFFKSGMFHSGSMNQRYVFPIFNKDGKIHGWSGRDMTEKRDAKWKHMGGKRNWIFPFYIKDKQGKYPTQEAIKDERSIILVESIGDMLALWERGVKNVLVTFGLNLSSKLISIILGCNINNVYICLNNDVDSKSNHGKNASIQMFIQLATVIDIDKIKIALPLGCKDFGELHNNDELFEKWKNSLVSINTKSIHGAVYKYICSLPKKEATKTQLQIADSLKEIYSEL